MSDRSPRPWVVALARLIQRRAEQQHTTTPRRRVLWLRAGLGGTIQEQFESFDALNPWVYDHLVELALGLRRRGRDRIGIGMLYEVLRWQYFMTTTDPASDFKLNNNYRSRYARLIMVQEIELVDAFEIRELKAA